MTPSEFLKAIGPDLDRIETLSNELSAACRGLLVKCEVPQREFCNIARDCSMVGIDGPTKRLAVEQIVLDELERRALPAIVGGVLVVDPPGKPGYENALRRASREYAERVGLAFVSEAQGLQNQAIARIKNRARQASKKA